MNALIRNIAVIVLAMLVGAAAAVAYMQYQPSTGIAALVAGATSLAAPAAPAASTAPAPPAASQPSPPASASRIGILDENALVSIYEKVSPAVVFVTNKGAQQRAPTQNPLPRIPGFPQIPQTPEPRQGTGSGVIVDDQGHILTNNHVADATDTLDVTLPDGNTVQGKVLGRDPGNDLAVLKIDVDKSKLTVALLGDSTKLKPGQLAIAIGNPFGLERTITVGVISSVGRTYSTGSNGRPIRDMIQTDAAINPGNSGGPLLNSGGEVIGITTAIESPVRGSVGVGFAVPMSTVQRDLPDLIAGKSISHPWLGISGAPVTDSLAKELGVPAEGVYVVQVMPDSPAQDAGIKGGARRTSQTPSTQVPKGGDVILSVDGQKVSKVEDISSYLDTKKSGDTITLRIRRGGDTKDVTVTLAEWPDNTEQ